MKRIKYVSRYSKALDPENIDEIVSRSREKNKKLGITGIMMTSGQLFYQIVEGPADAIDLLWNQIQHDDRHTDVVLLELNDAVTERFFPDWSMRKIELDSDADQRLAPTRNVLKKILKKRRELEIETMNLERAIWRELASKM